MASFKWNDDRLPLVEVDDFLVGEARWVERQAKVSMNAMGVADSLVARVIVSLKRRNIHMQWSDFDDMPLSSFDLEEGAGAAEDGERDEDPTPPVAEDGPSTSKASSKRATSGGSSS